MLIGIGQHPSARRIAVRWPSGTTHELHGLPAGSLLTVFENANESPDGKGFKVNPYRVSRNQQIASSPARQRATGLSLSFVATERPVSANTQQPKLRLYTMTATWCAACKNELPQLDHLRSKFDDKTLAMFGLPGDETEGAEKLRAYVEKNKPPYVLIPELMASERHALKRTLAQTLKSEAEVLPTTIVTSNEGHVLKCFVGVPNASEIAKLSRSLDVR
jgi:thiol-disulfide isomerase/thioredoxin